MVSPRRSARAESTVRARAARDPEAPEPLSTPRRMGVLVVVGALVLSILFAWGGSGSRPLADPTPTPTAAESTELLATPSPTPGGPPPTVTPVIIPPDDTLLSQRRVTLTITIPEPGEPLRSLQLRIYRNGTLAMDPVRVRDLTVTVRNVPLRRNENVLVAALANAGGEGPRSDAVSVTVDDRPPRIEIKEPDDGSIVNGSSAAVRGVTEPGLAVLVRNPASGAVSNVVSDDRGVFITEVLLGRQANRIEVSAEDVAGNRTDRTIDVVRGDGAAEATLSISRPKLKLGELPESINLRLNLKDPNGQPVDGVTVVFSISPPGLPTDTYEAVTTGGSARLDDVVIPREGAARGNGFVTARAELGPGIAASATKPLIIE